MYALSATTPIRVIHRIHFISIFQKLMQKGKVKREERRRRLARLVTSSNTRRPRQRGPLHLVGAGLGSGGALEHALGVADTLVVALLDTLEGEGGDEGGADTGTVLSGEDLDGVVALAERLAVAASLPVKDLLEGLSTTSLEVGVLERLSVLLVGNLA